MDFTLVSGRFTAEESKDLLTGLAEAKANFQLRARNKTKADESIRELSGMLDQELDAYLRTVFSKITDHKHVALNAKLVIEFCPDYHNE